MNTATKQEALTQDIIANLKLIYDPEIPVDIYELGLIYDVFVSKELNAVKIIMTLTTPNCPVAESLPQEVKDRVNAIKGIEEVELDLTFEPAWTQDMMSDEAKLALGFL
jgi:FeS assembly SUF system protein